MNNNTVRDYLSVHTWVGILSGIFLFVAFYAGGLTMIAPEMTTWSRAESVRHDVQHDADRLFFHVTKQYAGDPTFKQATLWLEDADQPSPFIEVETGQGIQRLELDTADRLRPLKGNAESGVGAFIDHIHRKAGLPFETETVEPFVGVISLLYGLALVSGVIVLLPTFVRDLLYLRIGKNIKRMWLDVHNLLGTACLPFHMVIAITAAVFCLHDVIYGMQDKALYADQGGFRSLMGKLSGRPVPVALDMSTWLPPTALIAKAKAYAEHDVQVSQLRYMGLGTPRASVMVMIEDPAYFQRAPRSGLALMHPVSGEITTTSYYPGKKESVWSDTVISFFALHMGSYGGTPVRVLYLVLGIGGAFLFYTGNLLWIESRTKRLRQTGEAIQPRHVRVVSAINVGGCLGVMAALSGVILAACWWGYPSAVTTESVHYKVFYSLWAAAFGVAFLLGAKRAAPWILLITALLTLAIPLSSLLLWYFNQNGHVIGLGADWIFARRYLDSSALLGGLLVGWVSIRKLCAKYQPL
jgi:uncharacterized iron-regulated membrane protein